MAEKAKSKPVRRVKSSILGAIPEHELPQVSVEQVRREAAQARLIMLERQYPLAAELLDIRKKKNSLSHLRHSVMSEVERHHFAKLEERRNETSDTLILDHLGVAWRSAVETNFLFNLIFRAETYWAKFSSDLFLIDQFQDGLISSVRLMERIARIRTLSNVLARIADLQASGESVLTASELDTLCTAVTEAFEKCGFGERGKSFDEYLRTAEIRSSWNPSHLWREFDERETAVSYFQTEIAPLPYRLRPATTVVKELQPALYKALASHCANVARGRILPSLSETSRAKHITDLLPGVRRARTPNIS